MEITQDLVNRFFEKVDRDRSSIFYNGTRCWEWTAYRDSKGYGIITIGGRAGKGEKAHRVSWIISNGSIQNNLLVCHHCDNTGCVNPSHLFLGTNRDNMLDMISKNRNNPATGSRNGQRVHPEKTARGDRSGAYTHPEMRPRGEDHGMAKLTWEQVREIRSRYKWLGIGGDSAQALAKEFGISRRNVCGIVNYDTWKE